MGERRRVDGQPAFVLHTYPFRETSLIVEIFARDHGRVALVARGARRPRSAVRGLLMAFQPLEFGWAGRGEIMTLMKLEWQGGQPLLSGRALLCGYYLNELLLKLLPHEDAHQRLFAVYAETLQRFAAGVSEGDLRRFETVLLQEMGYGLSLTTDIGGDPLDPDMQYAYEVERGPVRASEGGDSSLIVRGSTLLDLAAGRFVDPCTLAESKLLMRALLRHYLAGRELETRKIMMELQDL